VSRALANRSARRAALAAWLGLTAPGALVTCAVIVLAVLVANLCTPVVVVTPAARQACVVLLFCHVAMTLALALRPGRWVPAVLFQGLLGADALFCGLTIDTTWHGPAPLFVLAVLVMSLATGGRLTFATSTIAASVGVIVAVWRGIGTTMLTPTPLSFPTRMAVETSFAGAPATSIPVASLPTTLSVETWIAGQPAFATTEELFVPTLALVLVALCLGLTTTMWRVRRARTAVAAAIVAAARVSP